MLFRISRTILLCMYTPRLSYIFLTKKAGMHFYNSIRVHASSNGHWSTNADFIMFENIQFFFSCIVLSACMHTLSRGGMSRQPSIFHNRSTVTWAERRPPCVHLRLKPHWCSAEGAGGGGGLHAYLDASQPGMRAPIQIGAAETAFTTYSGGRLFWIFCVVFFFVCLFAGWMKLQQHRCSVLRVRLCCWRATPPFHLLGFFRRDTMTKPSTETKNARISEHTFIWASASQMVGCGAMPGGRVWP